MPRRPVLPAFGPRRGPASNDKDGPDERRRSTQGPLVDCAAYVDGVREPGCTDPAAALVRIAERHNGFVWVGLFEPSAEQMAEVADIFGLHELAVEDAVHAFQRPKLERYRRYTEFVIKTVRYVEHKSATTAMEIVETGEILMFLGEHYIITVRHGEHSDLAGLRKSLEADPEHLAMGPGAVMHAIADRVVDHYLAVVEELEDDIDEMEIAVFDPTSKVSTAQIYLLKREVLELRRAVAPLRKPLQTLVNDPSHLLPQSIREYFRDVEDHLSHVAEQVSTFDDLLTTLVNASLAEVTIQQNVDMRKISSWAAIALVPTAIAGIYGMNFDFMPELKWPIGYPLAILLILIVCTLLYRALRKRGWL